MCYLHSKVAQFNVYSVFKGHCYLVLIVEKKNTNMYVLVSVFFFLPLQEEIKYLKQKVMTETFRDSKAVVRC